jgi:predicted nucleotidyltransferase
MNEELFQRYINSIKTEVDKSPDKILSVILFGSTVKKRNKHSHSTDVDLLVIISDSCSTEEFKKIKYRLLRIEGNFFSHFREKEISFFSKGLQNATGMFTNIFISRFADFKERKFHRVFDINPIIGSILAPKNSVWISLLKQHRILIGQNPFLAWKTTPMVSLSDIYKSFVMNWLLALGSLAFFPIYAKIAKFSMEAMKWSLFTWTNYYRFPMMSHKQIVARFLTNSSILERRALQQFFLFREGEKTSKFFPILSLLFVYKLHLSLVKLYRRRD